MAVRPALAELEGAEGAIARREQDLADRGRKLRKVERHLSSLHTMTPQRAGT